MKKFLIGLLYKGIGIPLFAVGFFLSVSLSIPYWVITGRDLLKDYSELIDKTNLKEYLE